MAARAAHARAAHFLCGEELAATRWAANVFYALSTVRYSSSPRISTEFIAGSAMTMNRHVISRVDMVLVR